MHSSVPEVEETSAPAELKALDAKLMNVEVVSALVSEESALTIRKYRVIVRSVGVVPTGNVGVTVDV